jgi:hypothetical protein
LIITKNPRIAKSYASMEQDHRNHDVGRGPPRIERLPYLEARKLVRRHRQAFEKLMTATIAPPEGTRVVLSITYGKVLFVLFAEDNEGDE